ncbi:MAG: YwaF family protein [Acholeplasmatales bacterium]|jgi:uncharacterized membrane protein YwaF|nr:YwaF family protein [Acholeplasmatales bacterium]
MIVGDILISLVCFSPGILYPIFTKRTHKMWWLNILLGLFYVGTYLVWRYFSNNYHQGSFFHIFIFASSLIIPFILFYYTYDKLKLTRIVEIILASLGLFVVLSRFITWPMIGRTLYNALPLNICNIIVVLTFINLFLKKKLFFHNISLSLGLIGGLATLVMAFDEGLNTIWFTSNIDSYFLHFSLIVYPLYIFLSNKITINFQVMLKNFWIIIIYYILMFFINFIIDQNFMFMRPGSIGFLNDIYYSLPIFRVGIFEVNLLFYLLCLGGALALSVGLLVLFKLLQKKYLLFYNRLTKDTAIDQTQQKAQL